MGTEHSEQYIPLKSFEWSNKQIIAIAVALYGSMENLVFHI